MAKLCLFVTSLLLAMMFNVTISGPTRDSEPIWEHTTTSKIRDSEPIWEQGDFITTEFGTTTESTTAKESTSDYDSTSDYESQSTEPSTTTESAHDGHPYWESFNPWTSELPVNAIIGGYENETIYIIRSRHKGSLTPGKYVPSRHRGFIPWGYEAHEKHELEILRGDNYKWVQSTKNIPKGAVVGGYSERNNDPLYVCRGTHLGFTIPGKIDPHFKSCYIPYDDLEIEKGMGNYEVLVIPEEIAPPVIISQSSEVLEFVGGQYPFKINCEATGNPEPIITWKLRNITISNDSKYSVKDGNLIVNEPTVNDSQSYTCEANNDAGSVSATFQVEFLQEPQIQGEPYQAAVVGNPTEIECITKGVPKPEMTWEFKRENGYEYVMLQNSENVLKIPEVTPKDAGVYRCTARNSVGEKQHHTRLIIPRSEPNILSDSSVVYKGIEGKDELLRIPCVATGYPEPIITWFLNSETIVPDSKFSIEDGALVIKNPMVSDSQMYTCAANNEVGYSHVMFRVEIVPQNIDDPTPLSRQILRSFISRWFQSTSEANSDEPTI